MCTSNSSNTGQAYRRGVGAFVFLALALGLVLEFGSRALVPVISRQERRVRAEKRTILDDGWIFGRRVLIVGNSLLGTGINIEELRAALQSEASIKRMLIENTAYTEWFYGTQYLMRHEADCDFLVLVLSERQLATGRHIGEYFAYELMDPTDIVLAVHETRANADVASNLLLTKCSAFWGLRRGVRQWALEATIPRVDLLAGVFAPAARDTLRADAIFPVVVRRLERLARAAENHRARLVLVIPPALSGAETVAAVERAGRQVGVPVLVPLRPGALPRADFSDGMHLTPEGARFFTEHLAVALRELVGQVGADVSR